MRPSSLRSTATPIWPSNFAAVETSASLGTLLSTSGFAVNSAAHMMGSAAFFAPDTRTSPSSGRPPVINNLSILFRFFRRQCLHRQRVDFLTHAITEGLVDQLVAL